MNASDLPGIAEFLRVVFELILTWMEVFPRYLDSFHECQTNPLLFCADLPAAISQCGFELVELLGKIWGLCPRARNLFSTFKAEYIHPGNFARQDKITENGLGMSLTNIFGEVNGFTRVINVIKGTAEAQFPLSLTGLVLSQFTQLPSYVERQQVNLFASEVTQTLMHRLDTLSEQEIRVLDRFMARRVLNVLEAFIRIHQPQANVYEVSETYELRIAQKYLMSPFFDKKIRGMAEFKDIFDRVENRQSVSEDDLSSGRVAVCRFLNF